MIGHPRDLAHATLFRAIGALAALAAAAAITAFFYDRFWYPPDDGAYAHVASRILQGEILNGGVQDVHAGYVNFVNAAALAQFGVDFVSLRIPLALLNVIQALIVYLILRRGGSWLAFSGSLAVSSLSFVQFLNPTAHWYCLFLVLLIPLILSRVPGPGWPRLILLGLVVGLIAMFRQLTGVIVAIAVFGWLIMEGSAPGSARVWTPRLLLFGLALLVGLYVLNHADPATAMVFGAWPVALLLVTGWQASVSTRECLRMVGGLSLGAAIACLPLLGYHIHHASLSTWLVDTFAAAFQIPQLAFIEGQSFTSFAALVLPQLDDWRSPSLPLNALFWLTLILLPVVNGLTVLHRLRQATLTYGAAGALLWCASFYTLVALHYQIPIYLFYIAGLNAAALAAAVISARAPGRATVSAALIGLSVVALYFHAGQSLARGVEGTIKGERGERLVACGMTHCSLRLDARDVSVYRELVERIATRSAPNDCILALPSDAELYFITGRCNPTRFYNSALGLRTAADVDALLVRFRARQPAILIYRAGDKYNTALTQLLLERVRTLYGSHERVGEFDIYWQAIPYRGDLHQ